MEPSDLNTELVSLRAQVAALQSRAARQDEARERFRRRLLGVLFIGLLAATTTAYGQLVTFTPGTSARADDVNANFQQLRAWLEQKVGAVGNNSATIGGNATVGGSFGVSGATTLGTTTVNGTTNFNGATNVNSAQLSVAGSGYAVKVDSAGRIMANDSSPNYDVWIQGGTATTSGGGARNLALLGLSETGGDKLVLNWASEYGAGTEVQSNLVVTGNLQVNGAVTGTFTTSGEYTAERNNSSGTTETRMTSTSNSICFFTRVAFEDLDGGSEWGQCDIVSSGGSWYLQAELGTGGGPDADAWCNARCLSW